MAWHRGWDDDHTVQGVRRVEAVAPGLVDGAIGGVVPRSGRDRLGAIELVGHEDDAGEGRRRRRALCRDAVQVADRKVDGRADAADHQSGGEGQQDDRLPGLAAQTTRRELLATVVSGHTSTGDAFMTA